MDNRAEIEKAVRELGGVWPPRGLSTNGYHPNYDHNNHLFGGGSRPICTRDQFNHVTEDLQGKPKWRDVPSSGKWITQSKQGVWYAWSEKPEFVNGVWQSTKLPCVHTFCSRGEVIGGYETTLEGRPIIVAC